MIQRTVPAFVFVNNHSNWILSAPTPVTRIADIKPEVPVPKPTDIVLQKSAAFIEKVHSEADALTKKDIEQHKSQMEAKVAKIREQVTRVCHCIFKFF